MSDIKYTTDGKKVKIIGNLNSKEIIVQEIYITEDGQEIPGGENFIVKSLLDKPGISWEENEIKTIEEKFDATKKKYKVEYNLLHKKYKEKKILLNAKIEAIENTIPNLAKESFNTVVDLLQGNFKYVMFVKYSEPEIYTYAEFENKLVEKDKYFEGLKLLTLFGYVKGDLQWRINDYRDGSGSNYSLFFFYSLQEATEKALEIMNVEEYTKNTINFFNKYEIELDKEKLERYKKKNYDFIHETITKKYKDIKELEERIEEYK